MTDERTQHAPRISVVIPSFQRPRQLDACLSALVAQQLPASEFEVIVVDDGSAIPPRDVIAKYSVRLPLRLIEQRNAGPASARNTGARAARGTHVVFTDDDCRADPEWLTALVACIAMHPDAAIGGRIVNALPQRLCSTASQQLIDYLYRYHNRDDSTARFLITANVCVARRTFIALGGFDESFPLAAAEDRDFCERWLDADLPMVYCPGAVMQHAHDLTLVTFCRQHYNYGRGAHHLHRARARRGQGSFRLESLRFYRDLILAPFHTPTSAPKNAPRPSRPVTLSVLLMLSQLMYAVGYAVERWRARGPALLPVRA